MLAATNLAGVDNYTTARPFVDLFRSATYWPAVPADRWPPGSAIAAGPDGFPAGLADGQSVTIRLGQIPGGTPADPGYNPAADLAPGTYTFSGVGNGHAEVIASYSGGDSYQQSFDPAGGPFSFPVVLVKPASLVKVVLYRSDPADPLRGLRFLAPGARPGQVWSDDYVSDFRGFDAVRFMDLAGVNEDDPARPPAREWADRAAPGGRYTVDPSLGNGVPAEDLVELVKLAGVGHAWFCLPRTASADYCARFAGLLSSALPPDVSVTVELSNELWNGGKGQGAAVRADALKARPGVDPWEAWLRESASQAKAAHDAFGKGWAGDPARWRVLSTQTAVPETSGWALDEYCRVLGGKPPVLGVNGYAGLDFGLPDNAPDTLALGVEGLCKAMLADPGKGVPALAKQLAAQAAVAAKWGAALEVYEGGPHLVGVYSAQANADLTRQFVAANRHPLMGEVVGSILDAARAAGAGAFYYFTHCSRPGWSGSWGAKEYQDDHDAVKWKALRAALGSVAPASPPHAVTEIPADVWGGPSAALEGRVKALEAEVKALGARLEAVGAAARG